MTPTSRTFAATLAATVAATVAASQPVSHQTPETHTASFLDLVNNVMT
jgi:hypothetical protein